MTQFSPERCAALLMGARRGARGLRQPLATLPPDARPQTLADGIAAQRALAQLSDTAAPAGFKIGATAKTMQTYLGLPGPAAGFMPRDGLHGSGSTLSITPFLRPGVECEIAVHLAADLPPAPCTQDQAAAAVDGVMAAIEIVENRYTDIAAFGTPGIVADQVFHAAAVLGMPVQDWQGLDLAAMPGRMTVDGRLVGEGHGADLLGHPMAALAWLAGSDEAAAFGGLRAGQVVMLGSVTLPIWLDGPGEIVVQFEGLPQATVALV